MVMQSCWRMVLLLFGVMLTHVVVAADLTIKLEQDTVELGHPIWLTLTSDQTAVSLNTLDFSSWQDKVMLPRSYDVNLADDNRSQSLRLHLYPLHTGKLVLPGLQFLNHTTPVLTIQVTEARDAKQHTPIEFHYQVSTHTPWQQQQVIVACTLTLQDAYAVFTQPTLDDHHGIQVLPMQVRQHSLTHTDKTRTVYELGWILTPTRAGKLQLQLPPIQYVRDGVVARRFYVAPLTLMVKARPAWLPGTIPVGTVRVTHYGITDTWLSTDVLTHVQLRMRLDGMTTDAIPDYALQLRSDHTLRYYAAQRQRHTVLDVGGIHHQLLDDIPLVAKHIGISRLPPLRLQYFDPDSGTLKTMRVPGPTLMILNGWVKGIVLLVAAALLFWLLRVLLDYLLRIWRRYRTYQLALQRLRQSDSLAAIKQAMQIMAQAEGWSRNLTFLQWQARMQTITPLARQLRVANLNAVGYAQAELEITPVVQVLRQIGQQRRLALR